MSLRDDLAAVAARDARFHWQAYLFIFEALEFTKARKQRAAASPTTAAASSRRRRKPAVRNVHHVTGQELCEGVRDLALKQYGMLAPTVLGQWGVRSTSDLGDIVYNLIAAGDLEKTPSDSRADFNNVYDFAVAFSQLNLALDPDA